MTDLSDIKKRQQSAWSAGDWSRIAATMVIASERICETLDLSPGQRVLDVATGSGNTGLAAARRWCDVTAMDFVPALVGRGRERSAAERLPIRFLVGDAEAIPFPGDSFDVVLSTFGAMFSPDQGQVARELLRVCLPGGKIGMANWTAVGLLKEMYAVRTKYSPPPPGVRPATDWGDKNRLKELFGPGIGSLEVFPRQFIYRYFSAESWTEFFKTYSGPMKKALESMNEDDRNSYEREMEEVLRRFNRSEDGTIVAPCEYVEVVAIKK